MTDATTSGLPMLKKTAATANLKYFRAWAALLFVICFVLGPLVLFTFGFFCFAILAILWLSEPPKESNRTMDRVNGAILIIAAVWFLYNLVLETSLVYTAQPRMGFWMPLMALAFVFPPIIMHGAWAEHSAVNPLGPRWKITYRVAYPVSIAFALVSLAIAFVPEGPTVFRMLVPLQLSNFLMFCLTGVYGVMLSKRSPRRPEPGSRELRWWNLFLYSLATILFLALIGSLILRVDQTSSAWLLNQISIFARSLPLCFFFVGSYYESRFAFFDVFIKRGTFLFLLFILLTAFLSLVMPSLVRVPATFSKPRLLALFMLPILLTLPALYRLLERFLDRAWLGRSYSTVDAVKHFLSGMQEATSEAQMIERARERLSEIFQAEARIIMSPGEDLKDQFMDLAKKVPVTMRGERVAVIGMGRRANDTPYFAADVALLSSLSDVLSSLLENVRLQQKRREQEKKEQALLLHASRSELKALRAQVNPHFLFNALNAIAGLIPQDPGRAEETVEQLAEVFRYTLSRSENEMVRFEDELDFVRSYLEIEQARFGDRLRVHFDVAAEAKNAAIPTMMVQTMVENAVKHGVASVRGAGVLDIRAFVEGAHLHVEVRDNGPGFQLSEALMDAPGRSGYGLRNLVQRLNSHYGVLAELDVLRDETAGQTVVAIKLPASVTARVPGHQERFS